MFNSDRNDSDRLSRDTIFLYELGTLRHVQRTWRQFGGVPYANVAEHTLRVTWIAMMIASREGADVAKVIQLALLHDVAEIRTGDVNYLSRLYADRHEDEAISDMVNGTSLESDLAKLWEELKLRESLEAKIVKDADALDCDLELRESEAVGVSLLGALRETRDRAFARLYTDTARKLFALIYSTDPHSWHVDGKNRMTAGDWKDS
ncbi:MAG TPA: HD domain-containing protein [Streptosporangiaceae bacterium]|nr:HD domain-containing protein [Streptosporangiaceae bacterium]